MRLPLIASLIVLAGAAPALASGGVWCTSGAGPAKFDISAGMARSGQRDLFALTGTLEADIADVDKSLTELTFSNDTPHQLWLDRELLFLELKADVSNDGQYGTTELTIKTSAVEEGTFVGQYTFTVSDLGNGRDSVTKYGEISGAVSCGAD